MKWEEISWAWRQISNSNEDALSRGDHRLSGGTSGRRLGCMLWHVGSDEQMDWGKSKLPELSWIDSWVLANKWCWNNYRSRKSLEIWFSILQTTSRSLKGTRLHQILPARVKIEDGEGYLQCTSRLMEFGKPQLWDEHHAYAWAQNSSDNWILNGSICPDWQ